MHRVHDRRLAAIALLIVFALFAAACSSGDDSDDGTAAGDDSGNDDNGDDGSDDGGDDAPTTTREATVETLPPETDDPVPGGTLRYGIAAEVDGINPTSSALGPEGLLMGHAVFDTLTTWTPDGVAVPYVAESVTPNEDFTAWTLTLPPGVTFHDGEPLDAEAVVFNFEAQRNDLLIGLAIRPYYSEGAAEVVDELTVRYNLDGEDKFWPGTLAGQLGMMASPAWLEAALADPALNQRPIGIGPFQFDSRTQDSVTRFVRNDDYWGGEVWLDAVEFYPVTDGGIRVDQFLAGDLEGVVTDNPQQVARLREEDSVQNVINDTDDEGFVMMNASAPPFDDIRARQALTFATPKELYLELIGEGQWRSAEQMFAPEDPFYNPDVVQESDEPERAATLVAEFCAEKPDQCNDGRISMEFQYSGPSVLQERIKDILTGGWEDYFDIDTEELLQDSHIEQVVLGQFNVVTWRQFGAQDPARDRVWFECRTIETISINAPRFCDEDRDALIEIASTDIPAEERNSLWQQIAQKVNESYTYVFLNRSLWDNAFAENVRGVCDAVTPAGEPILCTNNSRHPFSQIWIEG